MIDTEPARDLLNDVRAVLGSVDRMRSAAVLRALAERWPTTYRRWSAQRFSSAVTDAGGRIRQGRVDGEAGQRYIATNDIGRCARQPSGAENGPPRRPLKTAGTGPWRDHMLRAGALLHRSSDALRMLSQNMEHVRQQINACRRTAPRHMLVWRTGQLGFTPFADSECSRSYSG